MKRAKKESETAAAKKAKKKIARKPAKPAVVKIEDVQRLVQLLQINQIELEHQNQELRIAEEELEVSRHKYVNLFDFAPIPYLTLDLDGVMKEVNLSASKMFGIERSKLIGKRVSMYIPLDEKDIFTTFIQTVFNLPGKQSCKLKVINKDKRVFHVQMDGLKLDDTLESDQKCQVAIIDVTEYKRFEKGQ
jgi:PAS domain S-box-containing protein